MKLSLYLLPLVVWPLLVLDLFGLSLWLRMLACMLLSLLHLYLHGAPRVFQRPKRALLLQIKASHYCEYARWALDRLHVSYDEENNIPFLNMLFTGRTLPTLYTPSGSMLGDSSDIINFYANLCHLPASSALPDSENELLRVPASEEERVLLSELVNSLGKHTRALLYRYVLLEESGEQFFRALLSHHSQPFERLLWPVLFPLIRFGIRRALRISIPNAVRSRQRVQELFDAVAVRLQENRENLNTTDPANATTTSKATDTDEPARVFLSRVHPTQLSRLDIAFASMATLVLVPPEYERTLYPPHADPAPYPRGFQEVVDHFRAHPAGQFALRLYREDRFQ
jgi:glutathione S-transferase